MLKTLLVSAFIGFLVFVLLPVFYLLSTTTNSQTITLSNQKVVYDLPYPGILPDHPLYFLKVVRDRVMEFTTRDTIKKAQLYLNFSDKRFVMGQLLVQKGKDQLAISTLSKGEKYFAKIPDLLATSKKQGVSPSSDLVYRLRLSNAKHREMLEAIMTQLPQGDGEALKQVIDYNTKIKKELDGF